MSVTPLALPSTVVMILGAKLDIPGVRDLPLGLQQNMRDALENYDGGRHDEHTVGHSLDPRDCTPP